MGRALRKTVEGVAYHVMNRRVMRLPLFEKAGDYQAFEEVLEDGLKRVDAPRLLGYCLMPNHWHLVVWPGAESNLSTWMQWLTVTHVHRWHWHFQQVGEGPVYQGRFKSFPIQENRHLMTVLRYVESNPLRAGLVERAEAWRWGSLWVRMKGTEKERSLLSPPPVALPAEWVEVVNRAQDEKELEALRRSAASGAAYGEQSWVERIAEEMGIPMQRPGPGRPRKEGEAAVEEKRSGKGR